VLIDRKIAKLSSNFVGVDNLTGAYKATEQLIRNGYQRIGLLNISPSYLSTIKDRELGYRSALKDNGMRVNNKLIRTVNCSEIHKEIKTVLSELIQPPFKIDAIFSVNNNITVACMEYLNQMNVRIPQDIAIVSFDDIDLFRFSYPTITAVSQPIEEIGKSAVNILLDEINGTQYDNKQLVLPTTLIMRRSCGIFAKHNGRTVLNIEQLK